MIWTIWRTEGEGIRLVILTFSSLKSIYLFKTFTFQNRLKNVAFLSAGLNCRSNNYYLRAMLVDLYCTAKQFASPDRHDSFTIAWVLSIFRHTTIGKRMDKADYYLTIFLSNYQYPHSYPVAQKNKKQRQNWLKSRILWFRFSNSLLCSLSLEKVWLVSGNKNFDKAKKGGPWNILTLGMSESNL